LSPTSGMPTAINALPTSQSSMKKIGAIVVVGMENRISGMFTERDLVHAIAKHGKEGLDQALAQVMTAKVYRCHEETTVNE
ncbi:CBS domain-containing protein, partial [Rhizobium ruizarguesonis]